MSISPVHDRVIVKSVEEQCTASGIVIADTVAGKSDQREVMAIILKDRNVGPLDVRVGEWRRVPLQYSTQPA